MSVRRISLVIAVFWAIFTVPAGAQVKLGDVVAENGYDWMLGKWAATDDNGRKVELEYKWILDKYAMSVNVTIGDFKYHGLIMGVPSWGEDYEGAVNRNKRLDADGTMETMDMVFIKVDNNSFKVKQYPVDDSGYRGSEARGETTFKRQKEEAAQTSVKGAELEGTWTPEDTGDSGLSLFQRIK